jgi:formate-dependent phosphoribosylglycinamide formyltransferase (GAR transformylase)
MTRHRLPLHRQAGDELSGKGQSKIDGPADVQKAWDYAMAGGRVARAASSSKASSTSTTKSPS